MSRQKIILLVLALALIGSGAGALVRLKEKQRLGEPGVKTEPISGSKNLHVVLPELVLNYESQEIGQPAIVTNTLPRDTSFGQRRYTHRQDTNDWLLMNVVLMGTDRTSMHKPQYCLEGGGWRIDSAASSETTIPISQPQPYDLPVIKLIASQTFKNANGEPVNYRGLYVYWFVTDGALSGEKVGRERMWWMAKNLLQTGVLQRWAYVSCFAVCAPGQEEATFERMKTFLAASVPEFQLTPKPAGSALSANP
jgi:hypothetical protein